jgi:PAS domain-containing protein
MDVMTFKYTYISDSCFRVTGYTKEEYLLKSIYDVIPAEYVEKTLQVLHSILERYAVEPNDDDVSTTFELQRYHKNGSLN